jgi:LysM repeat protein
VGIIAAAMPERRSARLLAPLALIAVAVVLVVVISSAGGGGSGTRSSSAKANSTTVTHARPRPKPRTYTVSASDTSLDSIAAKTGVPTARLIRLNPSIDPQSLAPGESIRLR